MRDIQGTRQFFSVVHWGDDVDVNNGRKSARSLEALMVNDTVFATHGQQCLGGVSKLEIHVDELVMAEYALVMRRCLDRYATE